MDGGIKKKYNMNMSWKNSTYTPIIQSQSSSALTASSSSSSSLPPQSSSSAAAVLSSSKMVSPPSLVATSIIPGQQQLKQVPLSASSSSFNSWQQYQNSQQQPSPLQSQTTANLYNQQNNTNLKQGPAQTQPQQQQQQQQQQYNNYQNNLNYQQSQPKQLQHQNQHFSNAQTVAMSTQQFEASKLFDNNNNNNNNNSITKEGWDDWDWNENNVNNNNAFGFQQPQQQQQQQHQQQQQQQQPIHQQNFQNQQYVNSTALQQQQQQQQPLQQPPQLQLQNNIHPNPLQYQEFKSHQPIQNISYQNTLQYQQHQSQSQNDPYAQQQNVLNNNTTNNNHNDSLINDSFTNMNTINNNNNNNINDDNNNWNNWNNSTKNINNENQLNQPIFETVSKEYLQKTSSQNQQIDANVQQSPEAVIFQSSTATSKMYPSSNQQQQQQQQQQLLQNTNTEQQLSIENYGINENNTRQPDDFKNTQSQQLLLLGGQQTSSTEMQQHQELPLPPASQPPQLIHTNVKRIQNEHQLTQQWSTDSQMSHTSSDRSMNESDPLDTRSTNTSDEAQSYGDMVGGGTGPTIVPSLESGGGGGNNQNNYSLPYRGYTQIEKNIDSANVEPLDSLDHALMSMKINSNLPPSSQQQQQPPPMEQQQQQQPQPQHQSSQIPTQQNVNINPVFVSQGKPISTPQKQFAMPPSIMTQIPPQPPQQQQQQQQPMITTNTNTLPLVPPQLPSMTSSSSSTSPALITPNVLNTQTYPSPNSSPALPQINSSPALQQQQQQQLPLPPPPASSSSSASTITSNPYKRGTNVGLMPQKQRQFNLPSTTNYITPSQEQLQPQQQQMPQPLISQPQPPIQQLNAFSGVGESLVVNNQESIHPDNSEILDVNYGSNQTQQNNFNLNDYNQQQHQQRQPSPHQQQQQQPPNDRNQYLQTGHLSEELPETHMNQEHQQQQQQPQHQQQHRQSQPIELIDNLPPPGLSRFVLGQPEFYDNNNNNNNNSISADEPQPPPGFDRMVPGTELANSTNFNMERQADGQDTTTMTAALRTVTYPGVSSQAYVQSVQSSSTLLSQQQDQSTIDDVQPDIVDRNLYLVPGESDDVHQQQQQQQQPQSQRVVTGLENNNNNNNMRNQQPQQPLQHQQQHHEIPMMIEQQRELIMDGENLEDQQQIVVASREEPIEGANTLDDIQNQQQLQHEQQHHNHHHHHHHHLQSQHNNNIDNNLNEPVIDRRIESNQSTGNDDSGAGDDISNERHPPMTYNRGGSLRRSEESHRHRRRGGRDGGGRDDNMPGVGGIDNVADRSIDTEDTDYYSDRDRRTRRRHEGSVRKYKDGDDSRQNKTIDRSNTSGIGDREKSRSKNDVNERYRTSHRDNYDSGDNRNTSKRDTRRRDDNQQYNNRNYENDSRYETEEGSIRYDRDDRRQYDDKNDVDVDGGGTGGAGGSSRSRRTGNDSMEKRYRKVESKGGNNNRGQQRGRGRGIDDRRNDDRYRGDDKDRDNRRRERRERRDERGGGADEQRNYDYGGDESGYRRTGSRNANVSDRERHDNEKRYLKYQQQQLQMQQQHAVMPNYYQSTNTGYNYEQQYAYYQQHQQYYENMRRTNPQAYAEWYKRYYGQYMQQHHQTPSEILTNDGRESVHSGRSSVNESKDRFNRSIQQQQQHQFYDSSNASIYHQQQQQYLQRQYHHPQNSTMILDSSYLSNQHHQQFGDGSGIGNGNGGGGGGGGGGIVVGPSSMRSYYAQSDFSADTTRLERLDGGGGGIGSDIQSQRATPCKFTLEHCTASLSNGLLVCVKPKYSINNVTNVVKVINLSVNDSTRRLFQSYPGPLVRGVTHKKTIIEFCQDQLRMGPNIDLNTRNNSMQSVYSINGQINRGSFSLIWNLLILLLKQNGMVVGTDISELLMKNKKDFPYESAAAVPKLKNVNSRTSKQMIQSSTTTPAADNDSENDDDQNDQDDQNDNDDGNGDVPLIDRENIDNNVIGNEENDSIVVKSERNSSQENIHYNRLTKRTTNTAMLSEDEITEKFRQYLIYGNVGEALEWATDNNLWGHALFLASKVNRRSHTDVMMKFANKLSLNDPLQTLYQLMSGRTPNSATSVQDEKWGDWRPHLAMILSNTSQKPELDRKSITTLGDSLYNRGDLFAAQFCYLMAQVGFGKYSNVNQESTLMSNSSNAIRLILLGSSHHKSFKEFAINDAIIMTEIYEYACGLNDEKFSIVDFQPYKYLLATRMLDYGMHLKTLTYMEQISKHIKRDPIKYEPSFIEKIYCLADQLKYYDPILEKSVHDVMNDDSVGGGGAGGNDGSGGYGHNIVDDQPWIQDLYGVLKQFNMGNGGCYTDTNISQSTQNLSQPYNTATEMPPTRNQIDQQFVQLNQQMYELNSQYNTIDSNYHQQQQQPQPISLPLVDQNEIYQQQLSNNQFYNKSNEDEQQQQQQQQQYGNIPSNYQNYDQQQLQQQQAQQPPTVFSNEPQQSQIQQSSTQYGSNSYEYWDPSINNNENPAVAIATPSISMPNSISNKPGFYDDESIDKQSSSGAVSLATANGKKDANVAKKKSGSQSKEQIIGSGGGGGGGGGKQHQNGGSSNSNTGWFGGIFNKLSLKPKNQMILPDDKNPAIVWDPDKKKWVNTDGAVEAEETFKPPPKMNDFSRNPMQQQPPPQQQQQQQQQLQQPPPLPPGQDSMATNYGGIMQQQQQPQSLPPTTPSPGIDYTQSNPLRASTGPSVNSSNNNNNNNTNASTNDQPMKTPSLQSNMFKMQRNRTLKNSYVDVFNPSGATSKPIETVMAPLAMPVAAIPQGGYFIPSAIPNSDQSSQQQQPQQQQPQPQQQQQNDGTPQFYNPNQFTAGYQ